MKNVYFFVDEIARDAVVASALKKHLAGFGIRLFYGNRRTLWLFSSHVIKFPFDLAVFPNLDIVRSIFKDADLIDFPIFILPTESVSGTEAVSTRLATHLLGMSYRLGAMDGFLNKISKWCLWGDSHLITMEKYSSVIAQRAVVVGHPRYDSRCLKVALRRNLAINERKKIGLITRFDIINIFDGRSNINYAYSMRKIPSKELQYFQVDNLDLEDLWHNAALDLRIFFNILDSIDYDKYEVTIRIHPRENRLNWQRLISDYSIPIKLAPWDQPFAHWLLDQDVLIAPPSTTFYDMAMVGKSGVSIQNIEPKRAKHTSPLTDDIDPILEFISKPNSLTELNECLKNSKPFYQSPACMDIVRRETYFPDCKSSLYKVSSLISDELREQQTKNRYWSLAIFFMARGFDATLFSALKLLRKKTEQSADFPLGRSRRKFIDSLAV